jgi:SPP1 gp7 family putative phage head morphogenesis protein
MWTNRYLFDSYKRGLIRARYELINAGVNAPQLEEGGAQTLLGLPMHLDTLGLIYTRVYQDLKGITAAMDSMISRILAQGLADGDGPALLARKLIAAIKQANLGELGLADSLGRFIPALTRAEILARTEIIRAHHLATIQEYRNWGIEGIIVKGEWKTAGDNRVCERCAALEGKIFTLDEIQGLIPLHPLCRCIALPYIVN